jgi:hypothetical protein
VELVHFEVKRRKNYRIPGSKTLNSDSHLRFCRSQQCRSDEKRSANRNVSVVEPGILEVKRRKTSRMSRFQDANFPLNTFFRARNCVAITKNVSANRNFVVELVHFEVKRRKNYRMSRFQDANFL